MTQVITRPSQLMAPPYATSGSFESEYIKSATEKYNGQYQKINISEVRKNLYCIPKKLSESKLFNPKIFFVHLYLF